jgi:hypothetical protein
MSITFHSSGIAGDSFLIGTTPANPARNAKEILQANPNAPTGFYWISWPGTVENTPLLIHCDMTGALSGSSIGGWMKFDIGTVSRHSRILAHNDSVNRRTPYYQSTDKEPTIRLHRLRWDDASSNGTTYFTVNNDSSGIMKAIKIRVPQGSRGLRIAGFDFYSVGGPDQYSFNDSGDNPTQSPNKQEIVSAGNGNDVNLGDNYSSFGIYFGDSAGNGKRFYKGNGASPWNTEKYNEFLNLPSSRFDQWDDIGNDADRIIWYESDGVGEYNNIYGFSFWIR